jgi:hypothetical protein
VTLIDRLGRARLAAVCALALMLPACALTPPGDQAAVDALGNRLDALKAETQQLEDVGAVERLQRAYAFYIDKGYWDEAADLFAAKATMEVGVDGVYVGQDHIRAMIKAYGGGHPGPGLPFGQYNHHMHLQPVVHVSKDGRTARARWREIAMVGQYKQWAAWGDGVLEDEYVKEDGVWKIKTLHLYTNFLAPYQGGWAKLTPATAKDSWVSDAAKAHPADRPPTEAYKPFPNMFTPPFHYTAANAIERVDGPSAPGVPAAAPVSPEVAELATLVDKLEHRVALLRSAHEIENLQGIYGYYVDKGMWTEAASLFTDDGTYEFGQGGVYVGKDHVKKALGLMGPEGLEQGRLNNYPMLQPIITVADDNRTAKARWRSDVQLAASGKGKWGAGVYENEYINDGGVWKISKLHYYVTMWADYDKGWFAPPGAPPGTSGVLPMDGPSKTLPPDRPPTEVYGSLPQVYLPPYDYVHPVTKQPHPGGGQRSQWKPTP